MGADERWELVRSIAGRASELVGQERDDYLRVACRGDASLHAEVDGLLRAAEVDDRFLVAPRVDAPVTGRSSEHFVLGEFQILRELGRGATAIVYLARQPSLNREVAVKVLVEGALTTPVQVERFHREARSVAKLRHPGIVRVFADGQVDRTHWFAMEYVPGHDLSREIALQAERKRGGTIPSLLPCPGEEGHVAEVARVCAEVAEALHYAHEQGLVHRDVKPQNLLLDSRRNAQIVDFGLARDEATGHLTGSGALLGTPYYMSPEQARVSEVALDRRTDVYSLGVVLYELCTLRRPFDGRSINEILARIQRDEPVRPRVLEPRLARDLETICLKAMSKQLDRRYADAGAMAADLRRFLRHEPIHARPPGMLERTRRLARRHRVLLALASVFAIGSSAASWLTWDRVQAGASGRLDVVASGPGGTSVRGRVSARRIDPVTGIAGEPFAIGALPLEDEALPAGYYRIQVRGDGGELHEYAREIERGRRLRIEAYLGDAERDARGRAGMIRVAGGTLALRDANAPLFVLNGRDVVVEPFLVDPREVTVRQYAVFLDETGHAAPFGWDVQHAPENLERPVVYVGWQDARAYAEWAGKRLLSFAEWNWIARGREGRRYPWADHGAVRGNVLEPLVIEPDGLQAWLAKAQPVGSHPEAATAEGIDDLFGNVGEWTETPLAQHTEHGFVTRMEVRLIAGHAWDAAALERPHSLETFSFTGIERSYADHRTGFRCAITLQEP